MSRTRNLTTAALLVALAGSTSGAAAQAAPTLSVTPDRPAPGETVTLVVDACPTKPVVEVQIRDTLRQLAVEPTGTLDQWQATTTADVIDANVSGRCGSISVDPVRIDVENPLLGFLPQGAFLPTPDPPEMVYGTDCSDGTTAGVTFSAGPPAPVPGGPPVVTGTAPVVTSPIPIDEFGDWSIAIPIFPAGFTVAVSATCGDVSYPELAFTVPIEPGDPASTTTPATESGEATTGEPPVAPPADARPGSATYTG